MNARASTGVKVNGFALREIRVRSGIEVRALADQVGVDQSYVRHLELGSRAVVSASKFEALRRALGITDRRALLADPHRAAS